MNKHYKSMMDHGKSKIKELTKFLNILKQRKKLKIDKPFSDAHNTVFKHIDCTQCANCCTNLGPKFVRPDIDRISKFLGMKTSKFIKNYLIKDEDDDIILNTLPCPFLDKNNLCSIYEVRPRACADYPHTNSSKMYSYLNITINNLSICPAVSEIVENVKDKLKI